MKSVQEVSKQIGSKRSSFGKTDVRYWQQAVFRPTYTRDGVERAVPHWAVKVQFGGRRETVSLGTANKAAAAEKARRFYLTLQAHGWDAALAPLRGQRAGSSVATVGEFLSEVQANWSGNQKTVADYARAFRKIVSDVFEIDGGTAKYDYRTGGRDLWRAKVDAVRLREITPDKVQKWKVSFLKRAGSDPLKERSASISVNSLLRQAKSLFAPAVLKFIKMDLPTQPFEGVAFERRRSMRYQSSFDLKQVVAAAQKELPREPFKIFLLAIMAGLRRNEIDKLEWAAFDWGNDVISIQATKHFSPKSDDSSGDVEVDPELIEMFRGFKKRKTSDFVVESKVMPRSSTGYSHYRCQKHFEKLAQWLREHGVTGGRPLHTLRKEYGSQVCAKHGIWAASRALRHADIAITSQHYLDKRQSMLPGLGALLNRTADDRPKQQRARRSRSIAV